MNKNDIINYTYNMLKYTFVNIVYIIIYNL